MPARTRVPKRTLARMSNAHVAIGIDGTAYLNAVDLDLTDGSVEEIVRCALREKDVLFIGVRMTGREARSVLRRFEDVSGEATAFVVGGRVKRRRTSAEKAPTSDKKSAKKST